MSLARRHALISVVSWSLVLVAFVIIVASAGIERFSSPDYIRYRTFAAAIILPGFLINTWIAWRAQRGRRSGELDERDERVARRASEVTLVVTILCTYLFGVVLWSIYKGSAGAPAGWFYVLAYLAVVLFSLVHAVARLIFDAQGTGDG